jgi:O-antigen ligase
MLGVSLKEAFYHPNPKLQSVWQCTQFGLLVFPISPSVGSTTIFLSALFTLHKQYRIISRQPLNWGFMVLGLLLLVTAAFANNKLEAFLGVFNFIPYFLAFAGLTALIYTPSQLKQIAWLFVFGSVPILVIGFGQFFLGWHFQFDFLWVILQWNVVKEGIPPGRMASVLMHANTLAAYLVTVFILGLGLWLENYHKLKSKNPLIIFLTVTVIANFIALILTNSRNGWAIAILACVAVAAYQGWRLLVAGFTAIVTSVLLAAFAPLPIAEFFRRFVPYFFWGRLNDSMFADRPVALMRKTQWEFAWSMSQQHPWTGAGLRSFSALYKAKMQIDLGHPHNLFLMLSAETGFPTTLLFCGLLIYILVAAVQLLWKSQLLASENKFIFFSYLLAFVSWIIFNLVDVTIFDLRLCTVFWVVLGAMCGVIYVYQKQPQH